MIDNSIIQKIIEERKVTQNNPRWCMEFTNHEIKKYLVDKTKEWSDIRYLVDDKYVTADSKENFEFVVFDGTNENFFVHFLGIETAIFINNEKIMFIDDDEKKYYTSSDVYDNIVYAGTLNDKSYEQILEMILKFVNLFRGISDIEVKENVLVPSSIESYGKSNYIINVNNSFADKGKYVFKNIEINVK